MHFKRRFIGISIAVIMLVSLCAVSASTSASAAPSNSADVAILQPTSTSASAAPIINTDGGSSLRSTNSQNLVGELLPVGMVGVPAACSQEAFSDDLFVRGTDNALWWRHDYYSWVSLGGILTSSPAAILRGATGTTLDVFVRGIDGACYVRESPDGGISWYNWYRIGGSILPGTSPAACAWKDGYAIFAAGSDHRLWAQTWTSSSGWGGWYSLSGWMTSSPGAAGIVYGSRIRVAARGSDGAYWYRDWDFPNHGAWSDWQTHGGQLLAGTGPALAFVSHDSSWYWLREFVTGANRNLYWRGYYGDGWYSLGGYLTSSPAAASPDEEYFYGLIDVFVVGGVGGNSDIWYRDTINDGANWYPWYRLWVV